MTLYAVIICVFNSERFISEERKLVTKRRSKRLRVKYTSEYANGDATEDKDIWQSSDDGKMKVSTSYQEMAYCTILSLHHVCTM